MTIYPVELTEEEYDKAHDFVNTFIKSIHNQLDHICNSKYEKDYKALPLEEKAELKSDDQYKSLFNMLDIYDIFKYILDEIGTDGTTNRIVERYNALLSDECKNNIEAIERSEQIGGDNSNLEKVVLSIIKMSVLKDVMNDREEF